MPRNYWTHLLLLATLLVQPYLKPGSTESVGKYRDETDLEKQFQDYLKEELDHFRTQHLTQQKITEIRLPDLCPPPTAAFSDAKCGHDLCVSHTDCDAANHSCCFNGCVFTCLPDISPEDVLDRVEEFNKNLPVALEKNDDENEIECSTAKGFLFPSCPEGYACQILELGDPLRAIPNRGICVNLKDLGPEGLGLYVEESASDWNHLEPAIVKESVYLPGGCLLTSDQFSEIEEFIKGRHFTSCTCSAGTVFCSVPQVKKKNSLHG